MVWYIGTSSTTTSASNTWTSVGSTTTYETVEYIWRARSYKSKPFDYIVQGWDDNDDEPKPIFHSYKSKRWAENKLLYYRFKLSPDSRISLYKIEWKPEHDTRQYGWTSNSSSPMWVVPHRKYHGEEKLIANHVI